MYATRQDLVDRFGAAELAQLTDRVNKPASTIDDTIVDRALGDASALIDGYLTGRYALPLTPVPGSLTRVCCDLARFFLWGKSAEKDGPIDRANTAAIAWLRDVGRGTVQLVAVAGTPTQEVAGGGISFGGAPKIFDRQRLRRM